MITRGSKFFYGAAAFGLLSALLYGFLTETGAHGGVIGVLSGDGGVVEAIIGPISLGWKGGVGEHVGFAVLLGFAGTMLLLGGLSTAFRDADAEALASLSGVDVADLPAPAVPQGSSLWPLLAAVGATVLVVGLAVSEFVAFVGGAMLLVAGFEWTVRAWSERISNDAAANAAYRDHIMRPFEVPIGAVICIAVVVLAISRVLLALPETPAAIVVIALASVIFGGALLLARRPELTKTLVIVVVLVAGLVIVGAGIAAGVAGPHEENEEGGLGSVTAVAPLTSSAGAFGAGSD
jgi:hypothetical protein